MIKLEKTIEKQLGLSDHKEYEMFALVPINSKNCSDQAFMDIINKYGNPEVAIRLNESNLSLRSIEDILTCREKT